MTQTVGPTTRSWRPARGSQVEPTPADLLKFASGSRSDWRPEEPSPAALRDLAIEDPAADAQDVIDELLGQTLKADMAALRELGDLKTKRIQAGETYDDLAAAEDGFWDSVGNLAAGR